MKAARMCVSNELVAELLKLPRGVEIKAFWLENGKDLGMRIEGEGLPEVAPGEPLPWVSLWFERVEPKFKVED